MTAKLWTIKPKPFSAAGHSCNIEGSMAGTIKILPSTCNTEAMVMGLARRIAAIPAYEEVLRLLSRHPDVEVSLVARECLDKGGIQ